LGNYGIKQGDEVKALLSGKVVASESVDTEAFNVTEQMRSLVDSGGAILACGTCLNIRRSEWSEMCPLSPLEDLYEIVKESDKIAPV
jgi:uncharacterized protein involved in oxidation of intracellular sulfur